MNIALDVSSVTMPSAFAELAAGVCWKPEEMIAMASGRTSTKAEITSRPGR